MFLGSFEGGVDAKGRVSIPAGFRSALAGAEDVLVFPAMDKRGCLEAGGEALIQYYMDIIEQMDEGDENKDAFEHSIYTKAMRLGFDATGRVSLPKALREMVGITDRVVFAGSNRRFYIWDPERFADYDREMSERAAANKGKLAVPSREAKTSRRLRAVESGA